MCNLRVKSAKRINSHKFYEAGSLQSHFLLLQLPHKYTHTAFNLRYLQKHYQSMSIVTITTLHCDTNRFIYIQNFYDDK